jgi:hypothetical protein
MESKGLPLAAAVTPPATPEAAMAPSQFLCAMK